MFKKKEKRDRLLSALASVAWACRFNILMGLFHVLCVVYYRTKQELKSSYMNLSFTKMYIYL